ncbi:MAG: glutaredoxin family protein [candidate division WOR-3 bacterium]|nr:glutaredoxin family protein [candidate division WOR-3 bacterium]
MKLNHIEGKNRGKIVLYALSTCGWCKRTKTLLRELGVSYDYIDVDLLTGKERDEVLAEIKKWNPKLSFPTLVIRDAECIVGFEEDKIKQALTND